MKFLKNKIAILTWPFFVLCSISGCENSGGVPSAMKATSDDITTWPHYGEVVPDTCYRLEQNPDSAVSLADLSLAVGPMVSAPMTCETREKIISALGIGTALGSAMTKVKLSWIPACGEVLSSLSAISLAIFVNENPSTDCSKKIQEKHAKFDCFGPSEKRASGCAYTISQKVLKPKILFNEMSPGYSTTVAAINYFVGTEEYLTSGGTVVRSAEFTKHISDPTGADGDFFTIRYQIETTYNSKHSHFSKSFGSFIQSVRIIINHIEFANFDFASVSPRFNVEISLAAPTVLATDQETVLRDRDKVLFDAQTVMTLVWNPGNISAIDPSVHAATDIFSFQGTKGVVSSTIGDFK